MSDWRVAAIVVLVAYLLLMLWIGYRAKSRIHGLGDFLVADRKLPFYLSCATLFATWFGGGTCMGSAGAAYEGGVLAAIADPYAAGVGLILAGFFYVGILRKMELLTVTDVFGRYYSRGSEVFASLLMLPVYVGWLGSQMIAVGYVSEAMLGIDATVGTIAGAAFMVAYTRAGGLWAVTHTDFYQVIVVVAGLVVLAPVVVGAAGGREAIRIATPSQAWEFFPRGQSDMSWAGYLGRWCLGGLGVVVGQDLIQRALASRTPEIARTSAITAGVLYLFVGSIPVLLGIAGRSLVPDLADPEMVVPALATEYLHPVLLGLFIGALISAIMSSSDSALLAAAALISHNVVHRSRPTMSDIQILSVTRWVTLVVAAVSLLLALRVQSIYALMLNSWATLFVCILVPVTAALYTKRPSAEAAWVSMIAGALVWFAYLVLYGSAEERFYEATLFGGIGSLLAYASVAWVRPGPERLRTAS